MKKIIIAILVLALSSGIYAKPIKDLSEDLVVACLKNLQTEDRALSGDRPEITCHKGKTYFWNVKWTCGNEGWGLLNVPVGSVWDVKEIRVKYKINKAENVKIQFRGRYNTRESYANDYIILTNGSMKINCEKDFPNTVGYGELVFENQRWSEDNYGWMQAVGISFSGKGSADMDLFSLELINSAGEVFSLWDYDWSMRVYSAPPIIPEGAFPVIPHTVYMGTSPLEAACQEGRERIKRLKELIPNLGCDCMGYMPGIVYYKDFYIENNLPAYYQFGGSADIEPSVTENRGHLMSSMGYSRDVTPGTEGMHQGHHEFDWTNQAVKDAFKEAIKRCGQMGIPQFQYIDAVWNCAETNNFGYGETTIENFRRDLKEEDEGLDFGVYRGKQKKIKFHEFLKKSGGIEIKPEDIGFESWSEYIPCVCGFSTDEEYKYWEEKTGVGFNLKNYFLFIMLKHYEWLKLFNEVGREGMKYGCDVVAMPNGSNWANANDMTGLFETANCKVLIDETRFYHPDPVIFGYEELPAWERLAGHFNKELRLICEEGIGGGANIYLHPMFSYIMNYALQSQGHYGSMQTDWIGAYVNENSTKECTEAWIDFLFKAWGYNDAVKDNGGRLKGFDRAIRLTTPLGNMVELSQKSTFRNVMKENSLPFIQYNFREWEDINPDWDIMTVDTVNIPKKTAEEIVRQAENEKKTVLLHSYTAGCESDGMNYTNMWYDKGNTVNNPTLFKPLGEIKTEDIREMKGYQSDGTLIDYKGEYYSVTNPNAKAVISFEDTPILSLITLRNGSEIYYYHLNAGVCESADNRVLEYVYHSVGIEAEGADRDAYIQRYTLKNGAEACILFNKTSFRNYDGPPVKWAFFDIEDKNRKAYASFVPRVSEDYFVYDFILGKIIKEMKKGETLNLEMAGYTADIYYLIPKSVSEDFLNTLNERREKLQYWETRREEIIKQNP